jgi:hypothetical protein
MVTSACRQAMRGEPHDFIYLEIRNSDKYLEKVAELYKAGHSLRDIAKQIDISKTKIRDLVLRAGIPLRTLRNEKGQLVLGTRGKRGTKPPYGYWYLDGQLQTHPKEYPVVLEILRRWKAGQSRNSIATWLNGRGIKSPRSSKWSWNTVTNILERLKNET